MNRRENNKQLPRRSSSQIKSPSPASAMDRATVLSESYGRLLAGHQVGQTKLASNKTATPTMRPAKTTNPMGASNQRMTVQESASQAFSLTDQQTSRVVNAPRPTKASTLMKKAHVRFDDYLDLNEENMRRSCKRLMNHLYSEFKSTKSTTQPSLDLSTQPLMVPILVSSCRSRSSQTPLVKCSPTTTGAPIRDKANTCSCTSTNRSRACTSVSGSTAIIATTSTDNSCIGFARATRSISGLKEAGTDKTGANRTEEPRTFSPSPLVVEEGKSYLRSQYERRQLRQLELMNKMQQQQQQQPLAPAELNIADGASNRRSVQQLQLLHQQDLVARSHELSKRRFFERLERRESIKNSNLSTPIKRQQSIGDATDDAIAATTSSSTYYRANGALNQIASGERLRNLETNKQRSFGEGNCFLDVHQSIVLSQEKQSDSSDCKTDTLGGSLRPKESGLREEVEYGSTKELAVELIGFYSPTPRSPASEEQLDGLIEFSLAGQQNGRVRDSLEADKIVSMLPPSMPSSTIDCCDATAFEVRVPEPTHMIMREGNSDDIYENPIRSEGCQHLMVKQVDVASSAGSLLDPFDVDFAATNNEKILLPALSDVKPINVASDLMIAIKTKSLSRNLTDSKVILIEEDQTSDIKPDGQVDFNETMLASRIADGGEETEISAFELEAAAANAVGVVLEIAEEEEKREGDSDNRQQQQQSDDISLTISSGNGNNSNSQRYKTISPVKNDGETTSMVESNESMPYDEVDTNQKSAYDVGGASNRARGHESPETVILVRQSGGAAHSQDNMEFAYLVKTQRAAQAQQVASLQTKITKTTPIREAEYEANRINPTEAVVSGADSTLKAAANNKQVNEALGQRHRMHHQRGLAQGQQVLPCLKEEDRYANAAPDETPNNNDHHESGTKTAEGYKNIKFVGENHSSCHQLIESYVEHSSLAQKKSSSSSMEEDEGTSSCSSSGFGASASVSVASSHEGSNSINVTVNGIVSCLQHDSGETGIRTSSLQLMSHEHHDLGCNSHYDNIKATRTWAGNQKSTREVSDNDDLHDYKELVGPDQAYPKSRVLIVENHNYASVLTISSSDSNKMDGGIVLERDESLVGYANLPRNKDAVVEYATVRSFVEAKENGLANSNSSISETGLSAQSYSTGSTKSGGFSTLPPAQVISLSTNNFHSIDAIAFGPARKRTSLLKRFGSLVSRAFNASTVQQSATSKTSETSTILDEPARISDQPDDEENNANASGPKSVLMIEDYHQVAEAKPQSLLEADLVILPTKHVNQRKFVQLEAQIEKNHVRRHDDRLSRGTKKHSRKMKKIDSSSITSGSSSAFSSSSNEPHHNGRPKKSNSQLEELESLMSPSGNSIYYRDEVSRLSRRRAASSSRNNRQNHASATNARIDIDCISPASKMPVCDEVDGQQSSISKTSGPRSLLRLFTSTSSHNRTSESTPNLADNALPRGPRSSDQKTMAKGKIQTEDTQEPFSGFWGFSSLMSQSHEQRADMAASKRSRKKLTKTAIERDGGEHYSLMYSNSESFPDSYGLIRSSGCSHDALDKQQSLNLYRNLLKNYARKRNHRRGHHQHQHHQHHSHYRSHCSSLTSRHRPARCVQNCSGKNYHHSNSCSDNRSGEIQCCCCCNETDKAAVWGQLIKINKSDGSQVVELQRSPGKSWGFFVARGEIKNVKGIFISRMHDKVTSDSLTGLLSIGDRILAIDECTIEPDYDLLRVNQMISKRSRIILKVKPFKG